MNKNPNELTSKQGLSSIERPRFTPGLLLEAQDLNAGVDYTRDMLRLVLRSLFGCGIVCGLDVQAQLTCNNRVLTVQVDPGVALDSAGNLMYVPCATEVQWDSECGDLPDSIWVVLEYREQSCRQRDTSCSLEDETDRVATRSAQGFAIRLLRHPPNCMCACMSASSDSTARTTSGCCKEQAAKAVVETSVAATPPAITTAEICNCYNVDPMGTCECSCDNNAVLLALLSREDQHEKEDEHYNVVTERRRCVRPVPVGYLKCLEDKFENQKSDKSADTVPTGPTGPDVAKEVTPNSQPT